MVSRLLLDDTVLIGFIGERRESCACRDKLNALQITGVVELWTTAFSYERLLARLEQEVPSQAVRSSLGAMAEVVNICSFDEADMLDALWGERPFSVAATLICREKLKADCVITYSEEALACAPGECCTPEGYFERLEKERGVVFELVDL